MKIEQIQLDELKQGIVGEIAVLINDTKNETVGLFGELKGEIEALAISTAKGFEAVNARVDSVETNLNEFKKEVVVGFKEMVVELKLNHEETKILRSDMNKQFNQVNADIQLRRLLLD